jgi:hypothetical protein
MAQSPWVLISNDDVQYEPGWFDCFRQRQDHFASAKLHNRFFAFLLHRSLIRYVGWFDERLTTIYWEDTDFVRRVHVAGLPWCSDCLVSPFFKSTRPPPGDRCYQEWYDTRAKGLDERHRGNLALYEEKWGDHDNNFPPIEPSHSRWPEVNWYPCAELPE